MPFLENGMHVFGGPTPEDIKKFKEEWKGKTAAERMDHFNPGWRKEFSKEMIKAFEKMPAVED